MPFRWIVVITLWTSLSGPVLSRPALRARPLSDRTPSSRTQRREKPPAVQQVIEARHVRTTPESPRNR